MRVCRIGAGCARPARWCCWRWLPYSAGATCGRAKRPCRADPDRRRPARRCPCAAAGGGRAGPRSLHDQMGAVPRRLAAAGSAGCRRDRYRRGGGASFAFAYASGAHINAVTAYRASGDKAGTASAIVVRKNSPLRTLAQLKGKRVATIRGSAGQNLVLRFLEREGVDPKSIVWTYLANGEAKAALASGSIDAWSTWGSYVGIAMLEDDDRVMADGSGLPSGVGFYVANDVTIANKRALLADYIGRLARARDWGQRHPDEYAKSRRRRPASPSRLRVSPSPATLALRFRSTPRWSANSSASLSAITRPASFPTFPRRLTATTVRSTATSCAPGNEGRQMEAGHERTRLQRLWLRPCSYACAFRAYLSAKPRAFSASRRRWRPFSDAALRLRPRIVWTQPIGSCPCACWKARATSS